MEVRIRRLAKIRNSTLLQANKFRKGHQGRDPPLLGCVFQRLRAVQLLETGKREWQNLLLFRTRKGSSHAHESSNHLVARAHSSGPIGRSPQKVKGGAGHRDNRRRQTAEWSSVTSLTASDDSSFLKRWSRGQENCVSRYYCHTILANHGRPIDILFGLATRLEGNCHPICAPITK